MPVFDFKCPGCELKKDDVFVHRHDAVVKCTRCGAQMKRLFTTSAKFVAADVFPAEGVHLEHVSPEGHTFHSKQEMRDYEREHNVTLGYLGHA